MHPLAELRLPPPVSGWRLELLQPPAGSRVPYASLAAFGALLLSGLGVAYVVQREHRRAAREAAQRVSFVNQVSHELKTPLTNIRMYAELLHERLGDEDGEAGRHLAVITNESERLGRLIQNVLSFGQSERKTLTLRYGLADPRAVVERVLAQFAPGLERKRVEAVLSVEATHPASFDADAVQQIVGNLLSNVEKYVPPGGRAEVRIAQRDGVLELMVSDDGPGIPERFRSAVFEPFVRGSTAITEGVGGSGLGLAISRELARLHGGDLVLMPSERGAVFVCTIRTKATERGQ